MFKKKEGKYCYETGLRAGQLAPLGHTSPARLTKVLEHLDNYPPPVVPEDAREAACEAVKQALKALDYDHIDLRVEGMMGLAEWISNAFGPPAEALGYELRNERLEETCPALTRMVKVFNEKEPKLHRVMLMILSNLVSDAFDKRSVDTKRLLESANIFPRLVEFVYDEKDIVTQVYACACLQNLCKDLAFARLLRAYDVVEELERLCSSSPNEHVRRYAAGALFNCVESVHRGVEARKNEEKAKSKFAKGVFSTADEGKTSVEVLNRLVNGHKVMWLANKPKADFEGRLKVVSVELSGDISMVGDRVKLEGGEGDELISCAFANYAEAVEENEDGTLAKKKKGRGLAAIPSMLLEEDDEEMNLPEHVLAQLAKREMAHLGERVRERHATTVVQAHALGWRARRDKRIAEEEAKATRAMQLAARFINAKAFRRRRGLLLSCTRLVQAYWRAQVASRYGLCSRRAALLMICVFRDMLDKIRHRRLTAEINAFYKERQAAWAVMREERRAAKQAAEAAELRRKIEEAEETGEPLPEGLVSKALAATVHKPEEAVLGVTARIPLFQKEEEPLDPRAQLRNSAAALGPPVVGGGAHGGGAGPAAAQDAQAWPQPLRTPLPPRPRLDARVMQAASAFASAAPPPATYSPMARSPTYAPGFGQQQQRQRQLGLAMQAVPPLHSAASYGAASYGAGSYRAGYGAARMGSPMRSPPMMASSSAPLLRVTPQHPMAQQRSTLALSPCGLLPSGRPAGGGQQQWQQQYAQHAPCALPAAGGMSSAQRVLRVARDSAEAYAADAASPSMMRRAASSTARSSAPMGCAQ